MWRTRITVDVESKSAPNGIGREGWQALRHFLHSLGLDQALTTASIESTMTSAINPFNPMELLDKSSGQPQQNKEPTKDEKVPPLQQYRRPDWFQVYRNVVHIYDPKANDLVLVTRETAKIAVEVIERVNGEDYSHVLGAAAGELSAAAKGPELKTHFDPLA